MSAVDGSRKRTISSVQNGAASLNEVRWASSRRIVFDINPDGLLRSVDIGSRRVVALGSVENVALEDPGESFSLSGDGRLVAFDTDPPWLATNQEPTLAIGLISSTGGHRHLLSKPRNLSDEQPSISPDGRSVAFTRGVSGRGGAITRPSLLVEAVTGGHVRRLGVSGVSPRWSPNGRWIAFLGGRNHQNKRLEVIPASGGTPRALRTRVVAFSWSPDSTRLAYVTGATAASSPGSRALGTIDLNGATQPLDLGSLPVGSATPQWSPDSSRIAFTGLDPANLSKSRVYAIDADGRALRRLA